MTTNLRLIEANSVYLSSSYNFYTQENRDRVHAAILENDPDLRRRIDLGFNKSDCNQNTLYFEAEQELYIKGNAILKQQFESVSESEKQRFEEVAIEERNQKWRSYRKEGRLIENEESLAQKAEDEKRGIFGPIPIASKLRAAAGSSSHQVTGTFISGQILTPLQELTPPFDRNTLKMKTGKIEAEEYF